MRKYRAVPAIILALISFLVFPAATTFSQTGPKPIDIRNIDGRKEQTPVYSVKGTQTSGKAGDWFRIFVEYDTDADWLSEVTFTFYVRVKGKTRDVPQFSVFKGVTTYIHIPKGRDHVADMYIHPNIISRFGDVDAIAVEAHMGGRLIARNGKPTPRDAWWEKFSPTAGVLLNRSDTPFAFVNLDTQEIIKPGK